MHAAASMKLGMVAQANFTCDLSCMDISAMRALQSILIASGG